MPTPLNEIIDKIKKNLINDLTEYKTDPSYSTNMVQYLNNKNLRYTELSNYTIQAMYILSLCLGYESSFSVTQFNGFTYKKKNQIYSLYYIHKRIFLVYEKHNKKFKEEKDDLNKILNKIEEILNKEIQNRFVTNKASIFNHLSKDINELYKHGEKLEHEIINSSTKNKSESFQDLFLPRKSFPYAYEIKSYILNAFSIIEYTINCLLPFWEQENGEDWDTFLEKCNLRNNKIQTWTDLYNPQKNEPTIEVKNHRQTITPAYINVVNIGIDVLDEKDPSKKIKQKYLDIKKKYRNMLTHGELGTDFTYGLTLGTPSIEDENDYFMPLFSNVVNLDLKAYKNVADFFDLFIKFCMEKYPAYWEYLMSATDIPIAPIEYFKYTNGQLDKTKLYIKYIGISHAMKTFFYIESMKGVDMSEETSTNTKDFYDYARQIYRAEYNRDFTDDEIDQQLTSDMEECQTGLGIEIEENNDIEEEEIYQNQTDIIHNFKEVFSDTLGQLTDEEIKNLSADQLIELIKSSKTDDSLITPNSLFGVDITPEEFKEYADDFFEENINDSYEK